MMARGALYWRASESVRCVFCIFRHHFRLVHRQYGVHGIADHSKHETAMGYPGHFAGGVEAAASAGGQITPPIMGAASYLMAEYLEVPYTTIVIAAIVPATMHYIGVMSIVHFTAKRLGIEILRQGRTTTRFLRGLAQWLVHHHPADRACWLSLFSGYSPNMAAFIGLSLCIVVGFCSFSQTCLR